MHHTKQQRQIANCVMFIDPVAMHCLIPWQPLQGPLQSLIIFNGKPVGTIGTVYTMYGLTGIQEKRMLLDLTFKYYKSYKYPRTERKKKNMHPTLST